MQNSAAKVIIVSLSITYFVVPGVRAWNIGNFKFTEPPPKAMGFTHGEWLDLYRTHQDNDERQIFLITRKGNAA